MSGAGNALGGVSEEQIEAVADQINTDEVLHIAGVVKRKYVDPHLVDIRQRSIEEDPDPETVREVMEDLSGEEKEEEFYETLWDFIATLAVARERPEDGVPELKRMLRDPYTLEALLLIFEKPDSIDPDYSETLKDFFATHIHWLGVLLLPEMYSDDERRAAMRELDMDIDEMVERLQGGPGQPP